MIVKRAKETDHLFREGRKVRFSLKGDKVIHEDITTQQQGGTEMSFDDGCEGRHFNELIAYGRSDQQDSPSPASPADIVSISDGMRLYSGRVRRAKGVNILPWQPDKENWTTPNNYLNRTSATVEDGVYHVGGYQDTSSVDTSFFIYTRQAISLPLGTVYLSFRCRQRNTNQTYFVRRYMSGYVKDEQYGCYGTCCKIFPDSEGATYGNANTSAVNVGTECDTRVILPIMITKDEGQHVTLGFDNPNLYGIGSFAEFSEVMLTLTEDDAKVYEPYTNGEQVFLDENNNIVEPYYSLAVAPNGFRGLKLSSGWKAYANYIDADGTPWLCDTIDYKRGVYLQRLEEVVLDGSESGWYGNATYVHCGYMNVARLKEGTVFGKRQYNSMQHLLFSQFTMTSWMGSRSLPTYTSSNGLNKTDGVYTSYTNALIVSVMSEDTLDGIKDYIHNHPLKLIASLYEPREMSIPVAIQKGLLTVDSLAHTEASVKKYYQEKYEVENIAVRELGDSIGNMIPVDADGNFYLKSTTVYVRTYAEIRQGHRYFYTIRRKWAPSHGTSAIYLGPGYTADNRVAFVVHGDVKDQWVDLSLLFTAQTDAPFIACGMGFSSTQECWVQFSMLFDLTETGLDTILTTKEQCEAFFGKHYLAKGKYTKFMTEFFMILDDSLLDYSVLV